MMVIYAITATATAAPLLSDSISLVEAISYVCVGLGAVIAGVVGYSKKGKETALSPTPALDVAAQVAAALGERDNQKSLHELTEVIRDQTRLQRTMDDTLMASRVAHHDLIASNNRLIEAIERATNRLAR